MTKNISEVILWVQIWYSGEVRKDNPGKIPRKAQRVIGKMILGQRVKGNFIKGPRWSSYFYSQVLSDGQMDSQTK